QLRPRVPLGHRLHDLARPSRGGQSDHPHPLARGGNRLARPSGAATLSAVSLRGQPTPRLKSLLGDIGVKVGRGEQPQPSFYNDYLVNLYSRASSGSKATRALEDTSKQEGRVSAYDRGTR